jgi:hypothetical protein
MLRNAIHALLLLAVALPTLNAAPQAGSSEKIGQGTTAGSKVLTATETAKFLPEAVFFRGQSASIQGRNSGGVRFSQDALFLTTLVDTSGYSSAVQEKYQAYLITEVAIDIEGHRLEPGAYGCGFLADDSFIVMDIGGHTLFSVRSAKDTALRRPTPLQVLSSPDSSGYRLYAGRTYVSFAQAAPSASKAPSSHL